MRADNTSVVTLMLDPPGPPRATMLRSRTTAQKPQTSLPSTLPVPNVPPPPAKVENSKSDVSVESDTRQVPQNGLTIMTRYSDVDKSNPSTEDSEKTPLPPCATIDGRFSVGHKEETSRDDDAGGDDSEAAISNYGNPTESYFMARLLNRSRVVNTLSEVYDEIVHGHLVRDDSEVPEPSPPPTATELPDLGGGDNASSRVAPPASTDTPAETVEDAGAGGDVDDVGIQINEVSSSSPTEGPPRPRGRRFRSEGRRDASTAPNDRVLRSHHELDSAPRPRTRITRSRGPAEPAVDRVVVLTRRGPPPPPEPRPPPRRPAPDPAPADGGDGDDARRATRSQNAVARGPRETRAGAGNSARAPGPVRRAPAARREAARARSKENLGGARRRVRAPAAPASPPAARPPPRTRRADSAPGDAEVHSTTGEAAAVAAGPERALRSRNEAAPARGVKRAAEDAAGGGKAARPAERCGRALGKRAAAVWAPALALRNRLRRRLVK